MVTEEQIWQALQQVTDPELPLSVIDLGMIYDVEVKRNEVKIDMTFTAMGCPAIDMLMEDVRDAVGKIAGVGKVQINVVWSPPWNKEKITSKGREILKYYGVGV